MCFVYLRWVWFSRPASMPGSSTFCTTYTRAMICRACPSARWSRAQTPLTATYHAPLRSGSSPSSWLCPLLSASSCASARWFILSTSASRNLSGGKMNYRGSCLQRIMRWRRWQHPGQSSGPKHPSEWIPQPRCTISVTWRLRKNPFQKNESEMTVCLCRHTKQRTQGAAACRISLSFPAVQYQKVNLGIIRDTVL